MELEERDKEKDEKEKESSLKHENNGETAQNEDDEEEEEFARAKRAYRNRVRAGNSEPSSPIQPKNGKSRDIFLTDLIIENDGTVSPFFSETFSICSVESISVIDLGNSEIGENLENGDNGNENSSILTDDDEYSYFSEDLVPSDIPTLLHYVSERLSIIKNEGKKIF